ncbi:hypothetical protein BH20ACI2_BH20ACI2_20500 [soil metagenome]
MRPITDEWIRIAEGDWGTAQREFIVERETNFKAVSFHSQQSAEKYLKAYLQDRDVEPDRTHDLTVLLNSRSLKSI